MDISAPKRLLDKVCGFAEKLEPFREMLLANLVMVSEIPSPTFAESKRIEFIKQRFTECGLQNCSTDGIGNGLGFLSGSNSQKTILLTAHCDTPFSINEEHTCRVDAGKIHGPGVADNSLGLATLTTLPTILERLDICLKNDLLFIAAVNSLDHGNLGGIRFFLSNYHKTISHCIGIEGAPLGRLQFRSMASLGGMISCNVNRKVSEQSAVEVINQVITRLQAIKLSDDTHTDLVLGAVQGGASYKIPARNSFLKFQLRSNIDDSIQKTVKKIDTILNDIEQQAGVTVSLDVIARSKAGGLEATHPFVEMTRQVMTNLEIVPSDTIYSSTISAYVEQNLPAICIGISNGENINYPDEYIEIDPITKGLAQLIGVLLVIDGELCA